MKNSVKNWFRLCKPRVPEQRFTCFVKGVNSF